MKKIIKYEISRYQDHYRLYKIIETDTGMNMIVKFTGSRIACEEMKKRLLDEVKNNSSKCISTCSGVIKNN